MAPIKKRSKVQKARHDLAGTATVFREDSDDELGYEDHPWEWEFGDDEDEEVPDTQNTTPRKRKASAPTARKRNIIGARMGKFRCKLGDTVLLKADGSQAWVGIVCDFYEDEGEKMAKILWFLSEGEIKAKSTKRTDFLPVCSPLSSIFGASF